ncbi:MAG: hypothetical protein LC804_24605 [Acidobacteria bacterium]|nr:hypothetical protein [Acidobacteriota bacterium]
MSPRVTRIAGLFCSAACAAFIVWIYARQPATLAQVAGGLTSAVGAYRIDRAGFDEGLRFFRRDRFSEARAALGRADPAQQDPRTQFYIAYTYYREGWGRLYNDDALFQRGLDVVNHAIAIAPTGRIVVDDATLGMRSADELKAELQRGLTSDASDLNPLRVFGERK